MMETVYQWGVHAANSFLEGRIGSKEMGPGSCRNERDVLFLVAMDPLPRAQQRTLREKEDSR